MKQIILIVFLIFWLTGCATLGEVMREMPNVDATAEISAVNTLLGDFVEEPFRVTGAIGIGYVLALLRRWYKKTKGAKG